MPAAIYLAGGPSGAGKDTLLLAAQAQLKAQSDDAVVFVRRRITRPPEKCTSLEVPLTEAEMDAAQARGEHAFYWEAHGSKDRPVKYAIPRDDLDTQLAAGKRATPSSPHHHHKCTLCFTLAR